MAFTATIGFVQPDGNTVHVWTLAGGKTSTATHKELLVRAIGENKLKESGNYIVASINPSGLPYASLFTVTRRDKSHWHIGHGLPPAGRVNRWPPKAS